MGQDFYLAVPELRKMFWVERNYPSGSFEDESEIVKRFYALLEHANGEYSDELLEGVKMANFNTAHLSEYHKMYKEALLLDDRLPALLFVERMKRYFPKSFVVGDYDEGLMKKTKGYETVDFAPEKEQNYEK